MLLEAIASINSEVCYISSVFLTPPNVLNSLCKCFSLFVLLAGYFELPQTEEEGEEQEVGPGLPSTKKGAGSLAEEGTFIQTDR